MDNVMTGTILRGIFLTLLLLISTALSAHQAGEYVSISSDIDDDLYLAGGQVELYSSVAGDVVVAGGQLNLEGNVLADVLAAGGQVWLRGTVGDDARLAGGSVRVLAKIRDDLVAAGGRVQTGPMTVVGGSAWMAGGEVMVGGSIRQGLRASGGRVTVNGNVGGDVEIWAEQVEIGSSAVISGNLHYRSPQPVRIADGAIVQGEVVHTPVEVQVAPFVAGILLVCLGILLSVMVMAVVLYLAFPGVADRCSDAIRSQPWVSLGIGLAVLAAMPLVAVLLLTTGIGALLALLLLAAYVVILLTGYIAGTWFVADTGLRKLKKDNASRTVRVMFLVLAILLLFMISLIPLIGSLVNWLVLLAGMGALSRETVRAYKVSA